MTNDGLTKFAEVVIRHSLRPTFPLSPRGCDAQLRA